MTLKTAQRHAEPTIHSQGTIKKIVRPLVDLGIDERPEDEIWQARPLDWPKDKRPIPIRNENDGLTRGDRAVLAQERWRWRRGLGEQPRRALGHAVLRHQGGSSSHRKQHVPLFEPPGKSPWESPYRPRLLTNCIHACPKPVLELSNSVGTRHTGRVQARPQPLVDNASVVQGATCLMRTPRSTLTTAHPRKQPDTTRGKLYTP